jgi:hypothetical protein
MVGLLRIVVIPSARINQGFTCTRREDTYVVLNSPYRSSLVGTCTSHRIGRQMLESPLHEAFQRPRAGVDSKMKLEGV